MTLNLKYSKIITLLLLTLAIASCKKDNIDPLSITVDPDYLVMVGQSGKNFTFTISSSGPSVLKHFKMQVQDNNTKYSLVDSTLDWGKSFSLIYNYTIPARSQDFSLIFYFYIVDVDGNTCSASRVINIPASTIPASEKNGIKIYTLNSGQSDAYDLVDFTSLMSTVDPTNIQDIVDVPDGSDPTVVSHTWTSSANAKFVSYNGFDYSNATPESIKNSFLSGTALGQISNIQAGSTILIETNRNSNKQYYAIQIVSINDDNSGNNDFYLLNIKY